MNEVLHSLLKNQYNFLKSLFSAHRLLEVRTRLYELLTHCIPADIIMKVEICFPGHIRRNRAI